MRKSKATCLDQAARRMQNRDSDPGSPAPDPMLSNIPRFCAVDTQRKLMHSLPLFSFSSHCSPFTACLHQGTDQTTVLNPDVPETRRFDLTLTSTQMLDSGHFFPVSSIESFLVVDMGLACSDSPSRIAVVPKPLGMMTLKTSWIKVTHSLSCCSKHLGEEVPGCLPHSKPLLWGNIPCSDPTLLPQALSRELCWLSTPHNTQSKMASLLNLSNFFSGQNRNPQYIPEAPPPVQPRACTFPALHLLEGGMCMCWVFINIYYPGKNVWEL